MKRGTPKRSQGAPAKSRPMGAMSTSKASKSGRKEPNKAASLRSLPEVTFLQELELLSVKERWRRVVEMGRAARAGENGADKQQMLIRLSQSAIPYERIIAAMGLWQAGCTTETMRLAKDTYDRVARLAIFPAANLLPDSDLLELLKEISPLLLPEFCKHLERAKRVEALLEQYFSTVPAESEKTTKLALLPWASLDTLSAQPASLMRHLDKRGWYTLARRYPDFAATFVKKELQENQTDNRKERAYVVLNALRRYHPSVGLNLLEGVLSCTSLSGECITSYAAMYPDDVARMVLKYNVKRALKAWRLQRKLNPEMFLQLFDNDALSETSLDSLFTSTPPNVRSLLYGQRRSMLVKRNGSMSPLVIENITNRVDREREALHILTDNVEVRMDPFMWVRYLTTIPFPQAVQLGRSQLRHDDLAIRSCTCHAIVAGGQYHPEYLDDILDFCIARENDNDLVRCQIINTLSDIPPSRWKEEHFPKLIRILKAMSDARDVSSSTCEGGALLVLRVAHFCNKLIGSSLINILERSKGCFPSLERLRLPKTVVLEVWACLLPLMQKLRDKESYVVQNLILQIGACLRDVGSDAVKFLRSLCDVPSDSLMEFAVETLLKYFRPTAIKMLPKLLNQTDELIKVDAVQTVVSSYIQGELLEKYLVPSMIQRKGKCGSRKDLQLVAFTHGYNWSSAKQQKYAKSVTKLLADKKNNVGNEKSLISALGSLHSANVTEMVLPFVQLDYDVVWRRNWVIHMLGGLCDTASLDIIVSALEDERFSVAIYSFRRRLRHLRTPQVLQLIEKAASCKKVSVQKGIVRTVGDCLDDAAYNFLMKMEQENVLHIHVKLAWLSAMFCFLDKRGVWDVLYRAAENTEVALATAVSKIPYSDLEEEWQHTCLCKLFSLLLAHHDTHVKLTALRRLAANPLKTTNSELDNAVFEMLELMHISGFLHSTLQALLFTGSHPSRVAARLASVGEDWRLNKIVGAFRQVYDPSCPRAKSFIISLVDELIRRDRQPPLICSLISMLPPKTMKEYLEDLLQKGLLHTGAAIEVMGRVRYSLSDRDDAIIVEQQLRTHNDPIMQRIGLALFSALVSRRQWNAEDSTALDVYCQSNHRWVSDDAKLMHDDNKGEEKCISDIYGEDCH